MKNIRYQLMTFGEHFITVCRVAINTEKDRKGSKRTENSRRKRHFPSNRDILGLGLLSDNNFQPITSFVSLALL